MNTQAIDVLITHAHLIDEITFRDFFTERTSIDRTHLPIPLTCIVLPHMKMAS